MILLKRDINQKERFIAAPTLFSENINMSTTPFKPGVIVQTDVRMLRVAAGMTQERAAERFNLSLRVWQLKEAAKNPALFSQGEYELLLLLAGKHPHFELTPR